MGFMNHVKEFIRLNYGNNYYLDGIIDEIRISNIKRNTAWISTSYNNQNDPLSGQR